MRSSSRRDSGDGITLGEGGYFIVRNSWGCAWGDGGYVYLSKDYLSSIIEVAHTIDDVYGDFPRVTLSANRAYLNQNATVRFTGTANQLVKRVAIHKKTGGLSPRIANLTTAPFVADIPFTYLDNGDNSFVAYGYDGDGNAVTSNTIKVRVVIPGPPLVALGASPSYIATPPATVTLNAFARDEGGIARVEFWRGAVKLGEDTTAPYTFADAIAIGDSGSISFTARAFDNDNNSTTSAPAVVTVAPSAAPTITSFTASATTVTAGDLVTLTWAVQGADSLTLSPPGASFSGTTTTTQVQVDATATYTLTATNGVGSDTAQITITATPPPFALKATCDAPQTIADYSGMDSGFYPLLASAPGSPVTLIWTWSTSGSSVDAREARVFANNAWGTVFSDPADTSAIERDHLAAGGGARRSTRGPPMRPASTAIASAPPARRGPASAAASRTRARISRRSRWGAAVTACRSGARRPASRRGSSAPMARPSRRSPTMRWRSASTR